MENRRIRKGKRGVPVRNPHGCTWHPTLNLRNGESRSMFEGVQVLEKALEMTRPRRAAIQGLVNLWGRS